MRPSYWDILRIEDVYPVTINIVNSLELQLKFHKVSSGKIKRFNYGNSG